MGLLADDAARAVACLVGGGLIVLLAVETTALVMAAQVDRLPTTVGFLHEIGLHRQPHHRGAGGLAVGLLRSAYSDPSSRRPSAHCGTWPRSGRGPRTRSPHRATASVRYLRSLTGFCCCWVTARPFPVSRNWLANTGLG